MSRVAVELVFSILVGTLQRVKTPLSYSLFAQSRKKKENNIEKKRSVAEKLRENHMKRLKLCEKLVPK